MLRHLRTRPTSRRSHPLPRRWRALLPILFGAIATAGTAAQAAPERLLPEQALLRVEVPTGELLAQALLREVWPLPAELPAAVQGLVGVGFAALRQMLGNEPVAFAGQLAAGGAAFALVERQDRLEPLWVFRPGDPATALAFVARVQPTLQTSAADGYVVAGVTAADCERALLRRNAATPAAPALAAGTGPALLRASVDLDRLRQRLPALRPAAIDQVPGAVRFLLAPLLPALTGARRIDVVLHADPALELELRLDGSAADSPFRALLPTFGLARRIPAPPAGALGVWSLDRSLRALLAQPANFLPEEGTAAVRSFLSIADQLDGARSAFTADLVGGLAEPLAWYLLPGSEPEGSAAPPLLLPALVAVAKIANPKVEPIASRLVQVLTVIANAERAQRNQRPFVVRSRRDDGDGVRGLVAELPEHRGPGLPPLETALSPVLLFGHGHLVLASTRAAGDAVLQQLAAARFEDVQGDLVQLSGPALAAAVARSRGPLELARVLDEGETEAMAAQFFDVVLAVLRSVHDVELRLVSDAAATTLRLRLRRQP